MKNLSFEQWVAFVFDHPVEESKLEWYWDPNAGWWEGPNDLTVQYLTRAFENAASTFQPYSDAQLNQGLWYLVSNSCSEHMFAMLDTAVPWPARQRCIRSFHQLYEQCFARRCSPHLSHMDEPGANPLNLVCYMWWNLIPIYGMPQEPARNALDQEILGVLESTVQLGSLACQESALHGLGHWHVYYPTQAEAIINRFLQRRPNLPAGLKMYAMSAYRGHVL